MKLTDWIDPITAGVGAVASLGSSLINRHSQKETNKSNARINSENNQFNHDEAALQRDWSAEQSRLDRDFNAQQSQLQRDFSTAERESQQAWQERMIQQQNEYSSPVNQLKMMREAGISTATFDGAVANGAGPTGVPSGAATQAAQAGGPRSGAVASASPSIPMQAPEWNMLSVAQAELLRAQADAVRDKNARDNDEHPLKMKLLGQEYQIGDFDLSNLKPAQVAKLEAETQEISTNIDKMVQEIAASKSLASLYDKQGQLVQKEVDSFAEAFAKKMNEADSRIHMNESQARLNAAKMAEAYASVNELRSRANLNGELASKYHEETEGQRILNGLNGIEFGFQKDNNSAISNYRLEVMENNLVVNRIDKGISQARGDIYATMRENGLIPLAAFTNAFMGGTSAAAAGGIISTAIKLAK